MERFTDVGKTIDIASKLSFCFRILDFEYSIYK